MILVALRDLSNYKQFAGEHRIEFPAQGIVGVIGANGVGKTTLFEAIEWCLYNPREIPTTRCRRAAASARPPSGSSWKTRATAAATSSSGRLKRKRDRRPRSTAPTSRRIGWSRAPARSATTSPAA